MESANMSNYRLMAPEPLKLWPNDSKKVENSWRTITYELEDMIDQIGMRFNNGTYCTWLSTKILKNETKALYTIIWSLKR